MKRNSTMIIKKKINIMVVPDSVYDLFSSLRLKHLIKKFQGLKHSVSKIGRARRWIGIKQINTKK